ncbi:uncharacterized protein LOC110167649 [Boleophthalmus pectinirostris]|uniref:uncharacterized protein LOC110167649 n=1 Tax=Boleophthalmus pectinirostris TaxID=150288 RepID=UPI0024332AD7|nr:uncharacterized protein LOC110167649 [Boleophthalmus pectinirostris]
MKTVPLIICAAILYQTQSSDLTKPIEIKTKEGETTTLTCVDDNITLLAPPPGCIVQDLTCRRYLEPLKDLSWSKGSVIIRTYSDSASRGDHSIEYVTGPLRGVLSMTISRIRPEDAGLYRCGVTTPAGLHIYKEYMITVTGRVFPGEYVDRAFFVPALERGVSSDRINITKVVGVEGKNIKVEVVLKPLEIKKPFSGCVQDYRKCQSFFQPLLYLKRNVSPEFVLHTYQDSAENGKYSLKYGQSSVTVGIKGLTKADTGQYICGMQAPSGNTSSTMFEIFVDDAPETVSRLLLLLLLIPVLLLMSGGLWYMIFYKKRKSNLDSQKADTLGETNVEPAVYENCPAPPSEPADSTYQSLSTDTRDHGQIYSSIFSQRPPL